MQRPSLDEIPEYFRQYTEQVPDGDVFAALASQIDETLALVEGLDEERAEFRYAEGKWSVKELVGHLTDSERVFAYRALSFARGDEGPLPGFDHDAWVARGDFSERTIGEIAEELRCLRASNLALFAGFSERAWTHRGVANGVSLTTRAIPWILAGHERHHRATLQERYEL